MPYAIRIHTFGGPEVMQAESVAVGSPGADQILLRQTAVGLNFIDVYERTGLYAIALPAILGKEAAGVVQAVGARVKNITVGDRVAYTSHASGAYCDQRVLGVERVVRIPEAIDDRTAAALLMKGLTAQVLVRQTYRVRKSDQVLIHAAAGGVGLLLVQWVKHIGATVIAVVGSEAKAALVRAHGADHVLLMQDDWVAQTRAITHGRGVNVVYDSVGKDTFLQSLDCLRPRGLMVTYGNASGPPPPIAPLELNKRGSLFLTRPTLYHYLGRRSELQQAAQELFDLVGRGVLKVHVGQTYALQEVGRAHRDLEARQTTGSTVLLP
jgi:NADPH:quinone reductase